MSASPPSVPWENGPAAVFRSAAKARRCAGCSAATRPVRRPAKSIYMIYYENTRIASSGTRQHPFAVCFALLTLPAHRRAVCGESRDERIAHGSKLCAIQCIHTNQGARDSSFCMHPRRAHHGKAIQRFEVNLTPGDGNCRSTPVDKACTRKDEVTRLSADARVIDLQFDVIDLRRRDHDMRCNRPALDESHSLQLSRIELRN